MRTALREIIRQREPFGSLEQEVFVGLQVAANRLMHPWAAQLRDEDLSPALYNVLRMLRGSRKAGLTVGDIGARLVTVGPDVTRLVDRLLESGLAVRRRWAADGRVVRVVITAKGLGLLRRLDPEARKRTERVLGRLGKRRLEVLAAELDALLALELEEMAPAGSPEVVRSEARAASARKSGT